MLDYDAKPHEPGDILHWFYTVDGESVALLYGPPIVEVGDRVHLFKQPDKPFVGEVIRRDVFTSIMGDDMGRQRFHRIEYIVKEVEPCPE